MEKKWLFIFLFVILLSSFIVSAVDLSDVEKGVEKVENIRDTATDEEKRSEFLKAKWTESFKGSKLESVLGFIEKIFSSLDPLWLILLGLSFSFSWPFVLTFMFGLVIFIIMMRFVGVFDWLSSKISPKYYSFLSSIFGFILILFLLSTFKIPLSLSNKIIQLISGLGNITTQFILVLVIFIALVFALLFSKEIKKMSILRRKEKRIENIEEKQEMQERNAKEGIKKLERRFEEEK